MSFGDRLKNARKKQGIKQKDLAKKLCVSPQNLSQYENDNRKPSKEMLIKLANALDLGCSYTKDGEAYFFDFVDVVESPEYKENEEFNRKQYEDAIKPHIENSGRKPLYLNNISEILDETNEKRYDSYSSRILSVMIDKLIQDNKEKLQELQIIDKLNDKGIEKVLDYATDLAKIEEYLEKKEE